MNYLLDTNIISETVKPAPYQPLLKWLEAIENDKLYISVITIGEIRKGISGIQSLQRRERILHLLDFELPEYFEDRILNIDIRIADQWGQLQSKNKGYALPAVDGFIAATAQVHNLILVTRNTKDFIHTSIKIINPWEEETANL